MIDVLGPEKRRRRSVQEKITIVQQSFESGMTVSLVARQHSVAASQRFLWRTQYQEGSLTAIAAGEQVVPAASAMKQITASCVRMRCCLSVIQQYRHRSGRIQGMWSLEKVTSVGTLTASSSAVITVKNCGSRSRWAVAIARHCMGGQYRWI